jgi:hypothetical protein
MAASGFTPIQLYHSTTAAAAPTAGNLNSGELAININDGKLFYKDSGGTVQTIATKDAAAGNFTTVDTTNLEVTNIKAKDGTAAASIADSTGVVSITANPILSGGTANGVAYLNGSKVLTTGSALVFTGTRLGIGEASPISALSVKAGNGDQVTLNNAGERFTQFTLQNNGTSKGALWVDNTNSLLELYGYSGMSLTFSANGSEGMRLTSTGLGIGTSSPKIQEWRAGTYLTVANSSTRGQIEIDGAVADSGSASLGALIFTYSTNTTNHKDVALIEASSEGATANQRGGVLQFYTKSNGTAAPAERARITSGGYFKASNDGTYIGSTGGYHELRSNLDNNNAAIVSSNAANGTQYGLSIRTTNDQNDATRNFLECLGGATLRAAIYSNGGLSNYSANNVNLASDERLKKDISPLATTWGKLKQIEVVNFRYKDCNEGDPLLYGVIAQQVQSIVPELVVVTRKAQEAVEAKTAVLDEKGEIVEPAVEAKEATPEYYGIREQPMYWLAIKALQEAMARIEALEAKVTALESKGA